MQLTSHHHLSLDEPLDDLYSPQAWLSRLGVSVLLRTASNRLPDKTLWLDDPREARACHDLKSWEVWRVGSQPTHLLASGQVNQVSTIMA